MSGRPNSESVSMTLELLERISIVDPLIHEKTIELENLNEEICKLREEQVCLSTKLGALLTEVDLAQTGNYGWSGRMFWFLGEFRRQLLSK